MSALRAAFRVRYRIREFVALASRDAEYDVMKQTLTLPKVINGNDLWNWQRSREREAVHVLLQRRADHPEEFISLNKS